MSVLSAWAELQVASTHQEYLIKVVKPHVAKLTPLWLSSLQDFARLRFEPDISDSTGPARPDEGLDVVYAAFNRQTLLKVYTDAVLSRHLLKHIIHSSIKPHGLGSLRPSRVLLTKTVNSCSTLSTVSLTRLN